MDPRSHRRQVLLFFVAVILPSIVLAALSVRMIRQENELAENRLVEQRRRLASDLGQQLLVRLERIKLDIVREQTLKQGPAPVSFDHPAVAIAGWVEANALTLPWEIDAASESLEGKEDYLRKIRQGENAEFVLKQMDEAIRLYQGANDTARSPSESAYARLLIARTLMKQGEVENALENYKALLQLSPDVRDENAVPISFYAAGRLLDDGGATTEILNTLQSALTTSSWLSPFASYMLDGFADSLIVASSEDPLRNQALDFQKAVQQHLRDVEQALALQAVFSNLMLIARRGIGAEVSAPLWIPYGDDPWLITVDSTLADMPPLAVVVRAGDVWAQMLAEDTRSQSAGVQPRLLTDRNAEGNVLGPPFFDLKVAFIAEGETELKSWSLQYSIYLVALVLVLSITLFGAYLLWRDMKRERTLAAMRSQFVASVSHELKTPLTAIRMFAETLRMGRSADAHERTEFLGTIVEESERLTRLLNNVLDFSKIEKGTKRYNLTPTSLVEVVEAAARAMSYPLAQEGFELCVEVADDLPLISVDRDAIEQAILNLLANALKYSGKDRKIDLHLMRQNGEAQIRVTDRGIGIDPAEQSHIFEKFYRADTTENESLSGTGLGLALVDHIAKAHGGRVELQSELGKGSTFSIHLPLEPEP